ncbi:MAG: hypothetical protein H7Y14_00830 [Burkholderiales bacterium]|nr:hypothetical protein [Burkholderiales bacterium]
MRLAPQSLLWRTLIVLVAALALSQAASLYLLHEFVTQPRAAFGMGQFVSHLKTISAALQTMTPEQQPEFIGRIAEKEGIRISPARGNERMRPAADVPPVRMFRERVREIFGPEAEVYVRGGPEIAEEEGRRARPQVLWIKLPAGEREFWVAFPRGRIERDATSALLAWSVAGFGIAALATFFIVRRSAAPTRCPSRRPALPRSGPSCGPSTACSRDSRRAAPIARLSSPACRTTCARRSRACAWSSRCSRAASSPPHAGRWSRTWTT